MNLNKLIIDTLNPLGVPVAFANYNQTADTYIVFIEYNQVPQLNADDNELITKYLFQVDIFSRTNYLQLVKDVKEQMKKAGFIRLLEFETYEDEMQMYRKTFRFRYDNKIEEEY